MSGNETENRSGDERREDARRGTGPELSIEQVFDGDLGQPAAETPPGDEQRLVERRTAIRREEDRELHDFLADTGTG